MDIEKIAKQAGATYSAGIAHFTPSELEDFARLVAEDCAPALR